MADRKPEQLCCDALCDFLNEPNSPRLGLHEVELTNKTTLQKRIAGIALRRFDKVIAYINFCPFCGRVLKDLVPRTVPW